MYIFYYFPIVIIVGLIEIFFSVRWNAAYFRYGIPVYRKSYPLRDGIKLDAQAIQNNLLADGWARELVFKDVGLNQIAFREEIKFVFFGVDYTPIMRGFILTDTANSTVNVFGYLNWTALIVALYFVAVTISFGSCGFFLVLIMLFGSFSVYRTQAKRFNRIGDTLLDLK